MAKKIKDTDYLFLSTRVRALETQMLTRDRMEQIVRSVNRQEEGGEGKADEFIKQFAQAQST